MILFFGPWRSEETDAIYPSSFGVGRVLIPRSELALGWHLAEDGVDLVALRLERGNQELRDRQVRVCREVRAHYSGPIAVLDPEGSTDAEMSLAFVQAGADMIAGLPATFHNLVATL